MKVIFERVNNIRFFHMTNPNHKTSEANIRTSRLAVVCPPCSISMHFGAEFETFSTPQADKTLALLTQQCVVETLSKKSVSGL